MNPLPEAPSGVGEDAVWVRIPTRLTATALRAWCDDIEGLLRIHPAMEFAAWETVGEEVRFAGRNLHLDRPLAWQARVERGEAFVRLRYTEGLKAYTEFRIAPQAGGAELLLIEDYGRLSEAERKRRLDEVDNSVQLWAQALYRYLRAWGRWRHFAPWRWYMRRVWRPMKPSARRISAMIWWISLLEFGAFLLIFTIFWLELDRFFAL